MSATLYVRTADSLKQAVQDYAAEHALTDNAAAVSLLERGLAAIADETSLNQLTRKLRAATDELERTRAALHEAELELRAARRRDQAGANVYKAVARRANQPLATCKRCRGPLSGADLFAGGRCPNPNCGIGITELLKPTRGGYFVDDYLAFIGVLGALVGLALDTGPETAA